MKLFFLILIVSFLGACNGEVKDPVEKADSTNSARLNAAGKGQSPIDKQTASFLVEAADITLAQSQLSELAFQKALDQKLKNYGSKMMHDHSMMNEAIKALGTGLQVTIPTAVGETNQKKLDDLKKKDNEDFDKALTNSMVQFHEKEISLFKKGSENVNNADVKAFIENGLPQLSIHLDSLKLIQKMLK